MQSILPGFSELLVLVSAPPPDTPARRRSTTASGHPAQVASTTISLVLALSGAGLFALPPAAVAVIKVLKDTIPGSKSSAT